MNSESFSDNDDAFTNIYANNRWKIDELKYALPMGVRYNGYVTESECKNFNKREKENTLFQALILEDDSNLINVLEHTDVNLDTDYTIFAEKLQNDSCNFFEYNNDGFVANYKSKTNGVVMFTVPYDNGWKCKVNGAEAQIYKADYGFMAIKTSAGVNNIEFIYRPVELKRGAAISLRSLVIFLFYGVYAFKRKTIS